MIFIARHWFPPNNHSQVSDCHWLSLILIDFRWLSLIIIDFFPYSPPQVSECRFDLIRIWDLQRLRRNGKKYKLGIWENIYLICYKYKLNVYDSSYNLKLRILYPFLVWSILVQVTIWKYISWTSYWLVLNHVISSASLVCLIEVCRSDID